MSDWSRCPNCEKLTITPQRNITYMTADCHWHPIYGQLSSTGEILHKSNIPKPDSDPNRYRK